ncbi:hypothetical protein [Methanosarcina lacustris]|uniref:hypothetical protein n=1 Tax=Methanosarcina lacustris TaxID=170861 RepID=UPI001E305BF9|nr:hypothetical protein [Methanosarcina lacustris]
MIFTEKGPEVLAQYGIEKEAGNTYYIRSKNAVEIMKHLDSVFGGDITGESTTLIARFFHNNSS